LFKHGEKSAFHRVTSAIPSDRRDDLNGFAIQEIFGGDSKLLLLSDLKNLVSQNWELLQHVFGNDKKAFQMKLDKINSDGRADAHANNISERVVVQIESYVDELLDQIEPYLN
jgi:hypothetical protein